MARIRTIKPETCTSEQVAACSIGAQLLFVLMLMFCDDAGVHPDSVPKLRGECFPLKEDVTDVMLTLWLDELLKVGLLVRYRALVDGQERGFLQVTGFRAHQKIANPSFRFPEAKDRVKSRPSEQSTSPSGDPTPRKGVEDERKGRESSTSHQDLRARAPDPPPPQQPSMLLPIEGGVREVVEDTLKLLGRAARALPGAGPDYSDPANRKARWETRVIEHLNATRRPEEVAAILEGYMTGTAAGKAAFELASKQMGRRPGGGRQATG